MMLRRLSALSIAALLAVSAGCNSSGSPPRSEELVDEGKDDGLAATSISPKLAPLVAFLRDDKNLTTQLGPEDTTAEMVKKRVKVVRYSDFGKAVDSASRLIAKNYQVSVGASDYRRGTGLVDLLSVGDMYLTVKAGYGEDSFIDKLIIPAKREEAKRLTSALLPEAALIQADHASTVSTGNYVLILGDMTAGQAIVMTVEYEIY